MSEITPMYYPFDKSIIQINENNQNLRVVLDEITKTNISVQLVIQSLEQQKVTLTDQLNTLYNSVSNQVVIPPTYSDPEMELLVNLLGRIQTYMKDNYDSDMPPSTYIRGTPFYNGISSLIKGYYNSTTLTIVEFKLNYTDTQTVSFRQSLDDIFYSTEVYDFETFNTEIMSVVL